MAERGKPRRPVVLKHLNDAELIRLRAAIEVEIKRRGLAFSVGEIGEQIAIAFLRSTPKMPKLQKAPTGTKNVDALSREGHRYSIKSVWNAKKTGTIYPDVDDPERKLFEYLLIARLDDSLGLAGLWRFAWDQFLKARKRDKRMNAWYVPVTRRALSLAEVLLSKNAVAHMTP